MASTDSTPLPRGVKDLTGKRFVRWTVLAFAGMGVFPSGERYARWHCRCECGSVGVISGRSLRAKTSRACGCQRTTHGGRNTPLYRRWRHMIQRCEVPQNIGFPLYGGRGIRVCHAWRVSFAAFAADMGEPPTSRHSLERIDVNGHYEPGNVRWATVYEQGRNKRNNHRISHDGLTLTLIEWSERLQINRATLAYRMHAGWSIADALTLPRDRRKRHT